MSALKTRRVGLKIRCESIRARHGRETATGEDSLSRAIHDSGSRLIPPCALR